MAVQMGACLSGLGSREEHGLPLFGQDLDDLAHLLLKPYLEDAVSLIND